MFYREHNPPHFHAQYGEFKAEVDIETVAVSNGYLPPRVAGLVTEWAPLHKEELMKNWDRCRNLETPERIEPLS